MSQLRGALGSRAKRKMHARFIVLGSALLIGYAAGENLSFAHGYSGGYRPGYVGNPRGAGQWRARHRLHGYIGAQLTGLIVVAQVTDYETGYLGHGGGGGIFGGVRFNPWLAIELNWNATYHDERFDAGSSTVIVLDSIYLMSITADAKIHIPTWGPIEPFIQAGIGFAYIGANYDDCIGCDSIFASGPAFNLGGGVDIWLGPHISVGGRMLYKGLYFNEDEFGRRSDLSESNYVNGINIDAFLSYHF